METGKKALDVLKTIDDYSLKNMRIALSHMESLETKPVLEKAGKIIFKTAPEEIQDEISGIIESVARDSMEIRRELPIFAAYLKGGSMPKRKDCPVFRQIWSGEMYGDDATEHKGLVRFCEELENTHAKWSDGGLEKIITSVEKDFSIKEAPVPTTPSDTSIPTPEAPVPTVRPPIDKIIIIKKSPRVTRSVKKQAPIKNEEDSDVSEDISSQDEEEMESDEVESE